MRCTQARAPHFALLPVAVFVLAPGGAAAQSSPPASEPVASVPVEQIGVVPIGSLLAREANPFDLEGRTLHFTPGSEGWRLSVLPLEFREELGDPLGEPDLPSPGTYPPRGNQVQPMARSWEVDLPFPFSFGGVEWRTVWVNSTGSLSFGTPETTNYGQRGAWADGTVRAVGAAIDVRAAEGVEQKIAPLWALYGSFPHENSIHVRSSNEEFVVTWNTVRRKMPNAGYDPVGPNVFQAVLTRGGDVRFNYREVPEVDGVTGIFPGGLGQFQTVDRLEGPQGDADPVVDILSAELADAGSILRFTIRMATPIPERLGEGSAAYRVILDTGGAECQLSLTVGSSGRSSSSNCVGAPPRNAAHQVMGRTVELFLSKTALDDPADFSWRVVATRSAPDAETLSNDAGGPDGRRVALQLPVPSGYTLSSSSGPVTGNYFEVFHYPAISKSMARVSARIHEVHPPEDDLLSVFTDFRIDDLFNHGPSTGTVNVPVQGIGRGGNALNSSPFGTDVLQVMHSPVYLGPRFSERVEDDERAYHGYAFAVGWISHELMHRWSAFVQVRHPDIEDSNALLDGCGCHWGGGLHNPSLHSLAEHYSDDWYSETSPMGGTVWHDNEDGTFTREPKPYMAPSGASALDLYVMGLMGPEEIEETFVLLDMERIGEDLFEARKAPVGISDIIAGSGVRIPPAHQEQTEFRMGVYLLHEDNRDPHPAYLQQSAEIGEAMVRYFDLATGGRMSVRIGEPTRTDSEN